MVDLGEAERHDEAMNAVYAERNALAVAFARLASAAGLSVANVPAPDAPGYRIVYIALPTGQVSWHIPDSEAEALTAFGGGQEWDGHDTATKYARLAEFSALPAFVAEVKALRAALRNLRLHVWHADYCAPDDYHCICGLTAAIVDADRALTEGVTAHEEAPRE